MNGMRRGRFEVFWTILVWLQWYHEEFSNAFGTLHLSDKKTYSSPGFHSSRPKNHLWGRFGFRVIFSTGMCLACHFGHVICKRTCGWICGSHKVTTHTEGDITPGSLTASLHLKKWWERKTILFRLGSGHFSGAFPVKLRRANLMTHHPSAQASGLPTQTSTTPGSYKEPVDWSGKSGNDAEACQVRQSNLVHYIGMLGL